MPWVYFCSPKHHQIWLTSPCRDLAQEWRLDACSRPIDEAYSLPGTRISSTDRVSDGIIRVCTGIFASPGCGWREGWLGGLVEEYPACWSVWRPLWNFWCFWACWKGQKTLICVLFLDFVISLPRLGWCSMGLLAWRVRQIWISIEAFSGKFLDSNNRLLSGLKKIDSPKQSSPQQEPLRAQGLRFRSARKWTAVTPFLAGQRASIASLSRDMQTSHCFFVNVFALSISVQGPQMPGLWWGTNVPASDFDSRWKSFTSKTQPTMLVE